MVRDFHFLLCIAVAFMAEVGFLSLLLIATFVLPLVVMRFIIQHIQEGRPSTGSQSYRSLVQSQHFLPHRLFLYVQFRRNEVMFILNYTTLGTIN